MSENKGDLISRSALLTVPNVRKVTEYDESGCGIDYNAVPVDSIETAPAVDAAPQWVSVYERLPDAETEEDQCRRYIVNVRGYITDTLIIPRIAFRHYPVRYWMPLPEPPKEVQTNDPE